jgi:hypothetical protein
MLNSGYFGINFTHTSVIINLLYQILHLIISNLYNYFEYAMNYIFFFIENSHFSGSINQKIYDKQLQKNERTKRLFDEHFSNYFVFVDI